MASDFQRQGAQILKKYAYFLFRLQIAYSGFGLGQGVVYPADA
jgi:hypothetical protein